MLGLDLDSHPEWQKNRGRVADRARLVGAITDALAPRAVDDVLAFCEQDAIPASRVRTVDDALFKQAGHLHQLIQPLFDEDSNLMVPTLASPILLNGQRACASLPPPRRCDS